MTIPNVVNLYHGGDLGDTVYAIPALRRLAYPAHLTLYPNPGSTRVLMDETNANRILPLLNIQPGLTADWKPTFEPDGLRLDFGVRRFYRNGYNLADIHSNWVGHDHWHSEHSWLVVDKPDYSYKVVIARSHRYRDEAFPWKKIHAQVADRACFIGSPDEHQDFEHEVGKIPYVRTPSLLEAARLIAGADLFIGNQSCPRAVAEGLKMPALVEAYYPHNTHFDRKYAWYVYFGDSVPLMGDDDLEKHWCGAAAERALHFSAHKRSVLFEIAKLTRLVRTVPGKVLEIGTVNGGTAAVLAWCLYRTLHITCVDPNADLDLLHRFLRPYPHEVIDIRNLENPLPGDEEYSFVIVNTNVIGDIKKMKEWLVGLMAPGSILVLAGDNNYELKQTQHLTKIPTTNPSIHAYQVKR